tara:strand:- start:3646 stop:3789 length:144 start_codon:yes stop_codon:yes gene_type:complete
MKPMNTRLAAHPSPTKTGIKNDLRTITFEDWIIYIIRENQDKLPWKT